MMEAALDYAKRGIKVFPLRPRGKEPLTEHGHKDATSDEAQIREWWSEWPDANVGAPTGANRWTVLDIDSDSPQAAFEIATRFGLTDVAAPLVRTGKGRHLYFRAVEGLRPSVRAGGPIDVRSGESYVVLPPSVHPNGRAYRWNVPLCDPLPEMPSTTRERLTKAAKPRANASVEGPQIVEGQRNDELARIAGGLRRFGCDEDTIRHHLSKVNASRCVPPLEAGEIDGIAKNISRYEPAPAPVVAPDEAEKVSLDEIVRELSSVLHFSRKEDYILAVLFASQGRLGPVVLPERCLAYLAFIGPKSAGKSTATEAICQLAGGRMIAGGTEAAIRSILDDAPPCLGVDELDVRMNQLPHLEGMFRTGNRWRADFVMRVSKGPKGWETVVVNVGGPKVFNYRADPEDALTSRTVVVRMEPHDNERMIVESLFNNPVLDKLAAILKRKGESAKARWDADRMEAHMKDPAFIARVARLDAQLPRGKQIGAVLLAVSDAMDFDADAVIAQYVAEQREDSLEPEREVLRDIYARKLGETLDRSPDLKVPNKDVHAELNVGLKNRGLDPITTREWPRIRRELGLETARRGRGLILIFGEKARKAVGIEDAP